MPEAVLLCSMDRLGDPGSLGVTVELATGPLDIIIVRQGGEVFGYRNHCPHTGVNLEWIPDQFLDITNSFIQCATHGALFRIEDGKCLRGPCAGDSLEAISLKIQADQVLYYPE